MMYKNCPICDSPKYRLVGNPRTNEISKNFMDKDYKIVQCADCKIYYVYPEITFSNDQWTKLYNNEYFSLQSNWLIKKRAKELIQRFNDASKYFKNNKVRFLDIGSGEGKALLEGLKREWDVTGIDIVDNRIGEAKAERIKFIKGNFLEYEFPGNYFDFIYLDSVLEHVLSPKEYLLKIKSILKTEGIVYIGVPNEDSLFNTIRKFAFYFIGKKNISVKLKPFESPYHIIGFNKKSLTQIFSAINLDVITMKDFGRKFDFLSYKINQRGFWIGLIFLLPIEFIGMILKRDVYYKVYAMKR